MLQPKHLHYQPYSREKKQSASSVLVNFKEEEEGKFKRLCQPGLGKL